MARTMISRSESLVLALGLAAAAVPAAAVAQTPAPAPVASDSSHTVKAGDTLWGLAQQYLGDPLLWPEIYRLNTSVVEDPHWIYPGEVLKLHTEGAVASVPAAPAPAAAADTTTVAAAPAPVAATPVAPAPAAAAPVSSAPAASAPATDTAAATPAVAATPADTATAAPQDTTPPEPAAAEPVDTAPLFPPASGLKAPPLLQSSFIDAYRPLKRSDFYSSGFLSEGQKLPYGQVVGNVVPMQIHSTGYGEASEIYSRIAIMPPKGGSYQVGDTLLLLKVDRVEPVWGDVIFPAGLAKVIDVSRPQAEAVLIAQYEPVHGGTLALLAEKFVDPGNVHPVAVANGVRATVLFGRERQDLKGQQSVVFLDKGQADGVRQGDVFEIHRNQVSRNDSPVQAVPDVVATLKVVHVGQHSATGRLIHVYSPAFASGAPARQVAKLPG